jgi:EVE domain
MRDLFEDELPQPPLKASSRSNWIAVASADHARRGRDAKLGDLQCGFMQVCHGKRSAVSRVQPGDRVAYYAPATEMGGKGKLQSFMSIGIAQPTEPYAFDMGNGFVPWRRDVRYVAAREAPIAPLIEKFDFVEDPKRRGYKFRFGLFKISEQDMLLIARAMKADVSLLHFS